MKKDRTSIILYVIEYKKCIDFYHKTLELKKMFETDSLTCFNFGGSYLMVEKEDKQEASKFSNNRIKTCLRLNVKDVKESTKNLISKNIEVDFKKYSWGTIAKFMDPDGNLCAFKDSEKFEKQILNIK